MTGSPTAKRATKNTCTSNRGAPADASGAPAAGGRGANVGVLLNHMSKERLKESCEGLAVQSRLTSQGSTGCDGGE
jgi:hypothetical protein